MDCWSLDKEKRHQVKTMHINAVLQENISSNQGRETCVLVKLIENNYEYEAYPLYNQSGNMFALTKADGYIIIPRLREGLHKGERVKVEVLK